MSARLVSLIGAPGSGKTTLGELLAGDLPATLVREDYAGNPFLAASFAGSAAARLPSQLYFLMTRARQLAADTWPDDGLVVSDYGYCQDRVYASLLLDGEDMRVYDRVAGCVDELVRPPDVLVYLDAPVEVLRARIAARGRAYEKSMTDAFLQQMRRTYERIVAEAACPALTLDTAAADPRRPFARAELVEQIRACL